MKYRHFTDFFTRTLKPDARVIEKKDDPSVITSPCDGKVLTVGKVSMVDSTIDCVKGRSYRLDEFMLGYVGNPDDKKSSTASKIDTNQINPEV